MVGSHYSFLIILDWKVGRKKAACSELGWHMDYIAISILINSGHRWPSHPRDLTCPRAQPNYYYIADMGSIQFWNCNWWAIQIPKLLIYKKMELELINLELESKFTTKKPTQSTYSKHASIEKRLAHIPYEVMDDFKLATTLIIIIVTFI